MNQLAHDPAAFAEYVAPSWFLELVTGLSVRAQFVVSGNVRDLYPVPGTNRIDFVPFDTAVGQVMDEMGLEILLIHDPVDGLRLHPACDPRNAATLAKAGLVLGEAARTPAELSALATAVMDQINLPMALILDYASGAGRHGAETEALFIAMDKACRAPAKPRPAGLPSAPPRNPVIWLVDKVGDLPDWFVTRNPGVQDLSVGMPDLNDRISYARTEILCLSDHAAMPLEQREGRIEEFSVRCDGMTLNDMRNVVEIARVEGMGLKGIAEALRTYRLGTSRNPWTSSVVRSRVRNALPVLEGRVKGQPRALERVPHAVS